MTCDNMINSSEFIAKLWLINKKGYTKDSIIRNENGSPDFICIDGKRYEVKTTYDKKKIAFNFKQIASLKPTDIILVVHNNEVIDEFCWSEMSNTNYVITNSPGYFEVKFYIKDKNIASKIKIIAKEFGSYDVLANQIIRVYEDGILTPIIFNKTG